MATYVVGDLQGCYDALQRLLEHVDYDENRDTLWFCGDLIARGPQSLECLSFVKSLGNKAITVLGNHDLHFIACHFGLAKINEDDKLSALFAHPHRDEFVNWLCHQSLIHLSDDKKSIMVHAGLAPQWEVADALEASHEVEQVLKHEPLLLLKNLYGNKPERYSKTLTDEQRWRFTINSCTRMRFCHPDGSLELKEKGHPRSQTLLVPWYEFWRTKSHPELFFGHWASLNGYSPVSHIHALDTGCVWGNALTAYSLEKQQRYSVRGVS